MASRLKKFRWLLLSKRGIIYGWLAILTCLWLYIWAVAIPTIYVLGYWLASASLTCGLELFLWERYRQQRMLGKIARRQLERNLRKGEDSTASSPEQREDARLETARIGIEEARKDGLLRLGGAGLIVAATIALTLSAPKLPQPHAPVRKMQIQFSDELENYFKNPPLNPREPVPNVTTLRLSDTLESAIVAYLKAQQGSPGGFGLSGFWLWFIICLVIVAEGALFWLALKHHPAAAPLIGIVDLIAMVLQHPERFPHPCGRCYCAGILALIGIGLILVVAGIFRNPDSAAAATMATPNGTEKEGKGPVAHLRRIFDRKPVQDHKESLLTVAVSVLLLAWVLLLLEGPSCVQSSNVQHSAATVFISGPDALPEVEAFIKGRSGIPDPADPEFQAAMENLKKEVHDQAKKGDMVLLFGSTDCIPFSGGNKILASNRAFAVKKSLEGMVPGVEVEARALPQHDGCKETLRLRGTYPYLIHLHQDDK